jgi:hypothetical protein
VDEDVNHQRLAKELLGSLKKVARNARRAAEPFFNLSLRLAEDEHISLNRMRSSAILEVLYGIHDGLRFGS